MSYINATRPVCPVKFGEPALVHHSDRGVQYVAVRDTERLAEAGAVASVGSNGDSYDNAMAEAFNSLFKAEMVRNRGPWKSIDDLDIAAAEYIDWFNSAGSMGRSGSSHQSSTRPPTAAQPSPDSLFSGSWKPPSNPPT